MQGVEIDMRKDGSSDTRKLSPATGCLLFGITIVGGVLSVTVMFALPALIGPVDAGYAVFLATFPATILIWSLLLKWWLTGTGTWLEAMMTGLLGPLFVSLSVLGVILLFRMLEDRGMDPEMLVGVGALIVLTLWGMVAGLAFQRMRTHVRRHYEQRPMQRK